MIFLFQNSYITFMPDSMLLCRSAWLWPLLLSSWSLPSLLLAFAHTKRISACASKILETSCARWVHHTFLYMAFTGHPNEDFLVPSQNYSNALLFCASVLAHEEVVGNSWSSYVGHVLSRDCMSNLQTPNTRRDWHECAQLVKDNSNKQNLLHALFMRNQKTLIVINKGD